MVIINNVVIATAEQVRVLLPYLTEEQVKQLGLREDYSVELRLKIGRASAIGSAIMNTSVKLKEGENWTEVGEKGESVVALPTELVLYLAGAALQNKAAQEIIVGYFGGIPDIVAP
ncbi:MAG: hypothetical protein EAZ63_03670 [Runella slithyformis]|nr:MAG: hypothetical protein EAZ63_03670 [Runella slithyformis]